MNKTLTKKQEWANEVRDAIARLDAMLSPGQTVYTVLRQCSRSGMSRHISLAIAGPDGIQDISFIVARALEMPIDRKNGGNQNRGLRHGYGLCPCV